MKRIQIQDIEIAFEEIGDGNPILLIHGMGGSIVWEDVTVQLSSFAKVYTIDLPGFGFSDKPKLNYSVDFYVDIIYKFLNKLEIKKINIIGLSFGGMIAFNLASRYPELINRIILVATAGVKPAGTSLRIFPLYHIFKFFMKYLIFENKYLLLKYQSSSYYNKNIVKGTFSEDYYEIMCSSGARDAYLSVIKNIIRNNLYFIDKQKAIPHPTLILWGKDDKTFHPDCAIQLSKYLPNSKVQIINNCGHTVPKEKPTEFSSAVSSFLTTVL